LSIADLYTDHYQSRLRNKLIVEVFILLKTLKYSSGFIHIRKELETHPEIIFVVQEIGGKVRQSTPNFRFSNVGAWF